MLTLVRAYFLIYFYCKCLFHLFCMCLYLPKKINFNDARIFKFTKYLYYILLKKSTLWIVEKYYRAMTSNMYTFSEKYVFAIPKIKWNVFEIYIYNLILIPIAPVNLAFCIYFHCSFLTYFEIILSRNPNSNYIINMDFVKYYKNKIYNWNLKLGMCSF